jgi:ribonuclease R
MARKSKASGPTRESVLEALASNPSGTKRDLARALHVSGKERIQLKRILKELESEGAIARGRKRSYERPGTLPEVTVLEITGQDPDGELLGRPQRWEHDEPPPQIIVVPGREDESHGPALGAGERILARLTQARDGYEARIIKRLGASVHKVLGVFHQTERGGRVAPIDRKSKYEFVVEQRDRAGAQANELVLCEPLSGRASGLPRARVIERLGSMNEPKAVSLIAIHAHGIPTEFPREALDEAERAKPLADAHGRTDLRKIPLVTIDPEDADRRRGALRHARFGARPRSIQARQLRLLPGPCRADAAGETLRRSLLADGNGPALPRRAYGIRPRRQQEAARIHPGHHALGRHAHLPTGAACLR